MPRLVACLLAAAAFIAVADAQSPLPPPWAYTVNPPQPASTSAPMPPGELRRDPAGAASGREGGPRTIPGSTVSLTLAQTRDANNPPDWFPDAHPPMPPSVAHGRKGELR